MKLRSRSMFNLFTLMALLFSLLGSAVLVTPAYAAGIVVNNNADTVADDGACTLREAITNANGNSQLYATAGECVAGVGSDTITFAADYTITLVGSQLPIVTTTIIINGNGAANTIVQADANPNTATYRVIQVGDTGNLTLDKLTIQNGRCLSSCSVGGGILNAGTLTLTASSLSGSSAVYGGGIANSGLSLAITDSTFSNNTAVNWGGAIFVDISSGANVKNSTFSGNSANFGGGIFNNGTTTVSNSTFSGNSANLGGGIDNVDFSILTITNSTFSSNSAVLGGGGIDNSNGGQETTGLVTLQNTIVANSTSGPNCDGTITADNFNLDTDDSCGNAVQKTSLEINLGLLANNGGPTQTFALLSGSSAIDAGDAIVCAASVGDPNNGAGGLDQRGITRPQGPGCDIGAFEGSTRFNDVSLNYWANSFIERLAAAGVTGGCGAGIYCPDATVTRAQMAVFLLKGMHGSSFAPPTVGASTGFGDVAIDYWAAAWIKQLAAEGITGGCGGGNYCPDATVTRAQMAVFLLKGKHGSSYLPPSASGVFTDVPVGYWADKWIEQLAVEGVTSGCGNGNYCPDNSVTRAQMAVFLVKAFNLP